MFSRLLGRRRGNGLPDTHKGLVSNHSTGYAENAAIGNRLLEPGMEVITKPFVMATLGNKIRGLIAR